MYRVRERGIFMREMGAVEAPAGQMQAQARHATGGQ